MGGRCREECSTLAPADEAFCCLTGSAASGREQLLGSLVWACVPPLHAPASPMQQRTTPNPAYSHPRPKPPDDDARQCYGAC
jgi:hypothetical protein